MRVSVLPDPVPNSALVLGDVPGADATIEAIACFALTFHGHKHWGSFEKGVEVAIARRHQTLSEIRTCLFFQQRAWRFAMTGPDAEQLAYWRALIEMIRAKVQAGDLA